VRLCCREIFPRTATQQQFSAFLSCPESEPRSPNLDIAEEIVGNRFKIAGGKPAMKVSWQVTGIRQDAWAETNRIEVEEDKPLPEQGRYLHPEVFGQPKELGVESARRPNTMKRMKEGREKTNRS
jgi:hypothetical protein